MTFKSHWTTTELLAIGSLAALSTILSLPGALLAGLTGFSVLSGVGNIIIIGLSFPIVALLFKRLGSVTLWSFISGILAIPFPIAGPPGLILKVFYLTLWGILADATYFLFKRSEKISAIAISAIQIGPGAFLAAFFWSLLGAPELVNQYAEISGALFVVAGSIGGGIIGYLGYLIYKKLEKTALLQRIRQGNK